MRPEANHLPPCTIGWRVLTLPPSISGAFVTSETSLHKPDTHVDHTSSERRSTHSIGIPESLIFLAVPPDPNNLTPASLKPLASSRRLDLSYTDKIALIRTVSVRS